MCPKNFTLTAPQVHRCAAVVLQDHLKLGDHGPKCRASLLFTLLLYAAARITSLSDACKTLGHAPSDEAWRWPSSPPCPILPNCSPTQRRLGRDLPRTLPAARTHGRRPGPDPRSWPAAARPRRDLPLRGQERDQPLPRLRHALRHPQRLPLHLASTPVSRGRTPGGGLEIVLHQAAQVGIRRRLLLLDRGFYSVWVIRYLQAAHHPFLMPVICRGRRLDDPRGPAGPSFLDLAEQRVRDLHLGRCPEAAGRRRDLCQMPLLSWSMASAWQATPDLRLLGTSASILRLGPGDVSPAVQHRDDLSTVASGPDSDLDTRSGAALLYVGIALILRNVWVWLHQMVLARPRRGGREIRLDLLRFRRMLLWLTHVVEGTLGVRDSVIVELQL